MPFSAGSNSEAEANPARKHSNEYYLPTAYNSYIA